MDYAIIRLGGKQYRVREGETLVVDRVKADEGKTFNPDVLLGEGTVTAKVIAHERGPKIRIGKYRKRTGYKRHNGFRAATSRIEISLGDAKKGAKPKTEAAPEAEVETTEVEAAAVETTEVEAAAVETAAPEVEAEEAPAGLPDGYADMTVAEIGKEAKSWDHEQLEAARAYEEAHAARKGAFAAIDSALAHEETDDGTDEEEES
jgi:large subunit ribosomal protein L21